MEDMNNLNEIDHTKQTVTLGTADNPSVSLMRGHVTPLEYVKGFREEGWDNDGKEPTEAEWNEMAECEKDCIEHTYGIFDPKAYDNHGAWSWNVDKNEEGAEPVTIRMW